MNRKENLNQSDREVIDENKVIENLLNGDAKNEKKQSGKNRSGTEVIYSKQVGCFDLKSILINLMIYTEAAPNKKYPGLLSFSDLTLKIYI